MAEQNFSHFLDKYNELSEAGLPFVVVTLVDSRGSAPQDRGARAIFTEKGIVFGTVGGGKVEERCRLEALHLLSEENVEKSHFYNWNLQRDIGMTCGGEVSYFFEVFKPQAVWKIVIFGAGHVSQELNRFLVSLNCQVTCVDHRQEWLQRLPESKQLQKILREEMSTYVEEIPKDAFVLLMTMGHSTDFPILQKILERAELPYLGVIGSEAKALKMRRELELMGFSQQKIKSFICPIGENIGNNSPAEISISILSQLLKYRDQYFGTAKRQIQRS